MSASETSVFETGDEPVKKHEREVKVLASRYGYELTRRRKHIVLVHPEAAQIVVPMTPSSNSQMLRTEDEIRRALRNLERTKSGE